MKYSDLINALVSYSNINLRFLNPNEFSHDTELENFFKRDELSKSSYPIQHTTDILRILTLYKFGGTYLNLDVICLVSHDDIDADEMIERNNFACAQNVNDISNGIVKFDIENGREIMKSYIE